MNAHKIHEKHIQFFGIFAINRCISGNIFQVKDITFRVKNRPRYTYIKSSLEDALCIAMLRSYTKKPFKIYPNERCIASTFCSSEK